MNTENLTVGQTVTIIPRVSFSADRDTEPGAQPWKAVCVGWTADKVLIEENGNIRQMNPALIFEVAGQAAYR